tara:strand:- start:2741 stop:3112 length:372 start_codon:yes stop_codon:yes gene_type:complete
MAKYLCTCNKGKFKGGGTKLYPTEVNSEGICIYCGYYAYAQPDDKHLKYPRNPQRPYDQEPSKTKTYWSRTVGIDKYYQYYHGADQPNWGQKKLGKLTNKELQQREEKVKNEEKFRRANGNRS